jgi:hypothetical protein
MSADVRRGQLGPLVEQPSQRVEVAALHGVGGGESERVVGGEDQHSPTLARFDGIGGKTARMADADPKRDLHRYLTIARDAIVWKLDGLSEYDVRRPMVPTGTNLLGLVKHVAGVTIGYFGDTFGRPFGEPLPWLDDDAEPNADMWATADESREDVLGLYRRAWAHADATIEALELDSVGHVPWWGEHGEVTLHLILIHMIAETDRHAGQADLVRELIDGSAGLRADNDNMAPGDEAWWEEYRDRLERAAREAQERHA